MGILTIWIVGAVMIAGDYCGNVFDRTNKAYVHPEPRAFIHVCKKESKDDPKCVPVTVYVDPTLTTIQPNPFLVDGNGHFCFYAPQAEYTVEVSASIQTARVNVDLRKHETGDYYLTSPKGDKQ